MYTFFLKRQALIRLLISVFPGKIKNNSLFFPPLSDLHLSPIYTFAKHVQGPWKYLARAEWGAKIYFRRKNLRSNYSVMHVPSRPLLHT